MNILILSFVKNYNDAVFQIYLAHPVSYLILGGTQIPSAFGISAERQTYIYAGMETEDFSAIKENYILIEDHDEEL